MFKAGNKVELIHTAEETAENLSHLPTDINYCCKALQELRQCRDFLEVTDTNVFMTMAKLEYEERTGKDMQWVLNKLDGVAYLLPEEELRLLE